MLRLTLRNPLYVGELYEFSEFAVTADGVWEVAAMVANSVIGGSRSGGTLMSGKRGDFRGIPGWVLGASLVLALGLQGCATLSKEECRTADWYTIGYEDGLAGRTEDRIGAHRKACAEHSVALDLARYREGRSAGLGRYCEARNGYRIGVNGRSYPRVCPIELEQPFLLAYRDGRELYDQRSRVARLDRKLQHMETELADLHQAIEEKEAELVVTGTTPRRRSALLVELRDLENAVISLEHELMATDTTLADEQDRLALLEQRPQPW